MQDVDQDPCFCPDFGELPDDLSEYMDEDILAKLVDNVVLNDHWPICEDDFDIFNELLSPDIPQPRQTDKPRRNPPNRKKRPKVSHSELSPDEDTPSRAKRIRAAESVKTKELQSESAITQGSDSGADVSPPGMGVLSSTPKNIMHLETPIRSIPQVQFISIPDDATYPVVRTLRFSPPIGLPPRFILAEGSVFFVSNTVPAPSPLSKCQIPPDSPVDGTVAPVQMSSSPPGSLSYTASKAMSPPCILPQSPSDEKSPINESPVPPSPTTLDIPPLPEAVKDYIKEAKAHMSQSCEEMEAGLKLCSHYVDVQVVRREFHRSGKITNKSLDKELVIMGETDRKKSMVGLNQIFESSHGNKPRRYILLVGNAGMGKTTCIRKLCLDWSRDCFPQFDFVFLLDGKALAVADPSHSLQTLLLSASFFAPPCTDPDTVFAQILAAPKRVLIIFDGFEELRDVEILLQSQEKDLITSLQKDCKAQSYTMRQLYAAILQSVVLPGCTLLLSTRPRGNVIPLVRRADSLLELRGFSPSDVEMYLSKYFTDDDLRVSAKNCLNTSSYLHLLCWNPGLCRLVCFVLGQSQNSEALPRTLTGLCHQVFLLKMEAERRRKDPKDEAKTQQSEPSGEESKTKMSSSPQMKRRPSRATVLTRSQRTRRAKGQDEEEEIEEEETNSSRGEADRTEEKELLSQLSSLAWEGVKGNSSDIYKGQIVSSQLKAFGIRTGLFRSNPVRKKQVVGRSEREEGRDDKDGKERNENASQWRDQTRSDIENADDHILLWANPFLQSYLAGVHLSLSRNVPGRTFLQSLPFTSGPKGRRRHQREELELTQRFVVGLLFHNKTELQWLHQNANRAFRDMLVNKQTLVTKHLEELSLGDLSPAQVLEACHYVYEGCFTCNEGSRNSKLAMHLAVHLPEHLTFHGVPLSPPDVFTVQNVIALGGSKGSSFSLDLQESGIQVSGIKALVGLSNIKTYRACIADVIALWEQLEKSGEEGLHGAVSKFKIHPLKVTQVCHVEHLEKLVDIHTHRRLSNSPSQSDSVLADGVPAVKELHKLEFELSPETGSLVLPKLWELLPGLHNLQHLDLEKSKIGDDGAEKLADALVSLCSLEILNLSQNCIGDRGVKKLATALSRLLKLHCLSLYNNVISDEGAESLAAALPHMTSLTNLDVTYNKLTDVGAQSLGTSLRRCKRMKSLRMWNQFIPGGVFERLQQQDHRILWH